jgi:hypothetical protein
MPEVGLGVGQGFGQREAGLLDALRGAEASQRAAEPPPEPRRGGPLSLSQHPEDDAGEAAARLVTDEPSGDRSEPPEAPEPPLRHVSEGVEPAEAGLGLGFELLWPVAERGLVFEVESALRAGDPSLALRSCEALVSRSLAGAAAAIGTNEAPRDPVTMALVLGIDGRRYLAFRSLAREARQGRAVSPSEALAAYALAIQIRIARASL